MDDEKSLNTLITKLENVNDASMPNYAAVLIESMKVIVTHLKCFNDLSKKVSTLEDKISVNSQVSDTLQSENKRLNDIIIILEERADDQEQRSRNTCLLIHGVAESDNVETDDAILSVLNNDLNLTHISINDIQRSHRLGPIKRNDRLLRSNKPRCRPIIVKFLNFRTRQEVFKVKSRLKGKHFMITESLTKNRYDLFKAALLKYGKGNVWTIEGRITTKINNNFVVIKSLNDL